MKMLTEGHEPGHCYELESFEGGPSQHLQFIEKRVTGEGEAAAPGQLLTIYDGTTNEEVLAVLIDRMNYLQRKMSCRENAIAITKMEEALLWMNKRTADRKSRGVEGAHKA